MSAQSPSARVAIRRITLRGLGTLLLFLIIAVLAEYIVVVYAMSLGVTDQSPLQWSFIFPGIGSNVTLTISPLFHLVPIAVVITLVSSWAYLRRQVATKPSEAQRGKLTSVSKRMKRQKRTFTDRLGSIFSRKERPTSLGREVRLRRANVRSALIVLIVFSALLLLISLFTYPNLLYQAVASIYENNPSLINFVKGAGAALAPIGAVFSSINNALLTTSPGFRGFVLTLGLLVSPLATLDNAGKYLAFQNGAAWISAFIILLYGEYGRKSPRQIRK
jgi:hypothetical protein